MRRLTTHDRDDRGVVTLFVIGTLTVLFIAAALAIDVGRHVVENRKAQNSADATVLAVATDCARKNPVTGDYSKYYKNGQTINAPFCGSGETTITVTEPVTDGLLLNTDARTVHRSATARWGTLGTATTVPITISDCEFSQALLDGTTDIVLYLDDPNPHTGCSSVPGGFSQLVNTSCAVTVSAGGTVPGAPGGDLQKQIDCITNPTAPALPHDVLVPMYDSVACNASTACKGHGEYPIVGFAMFRVTGYSFNGSNNEGLGKKCPDETHGKYCIRGDFVRFVSSQGTPGPSTDFGTVQVYLYS